MKNAEHGCCGDGSPDGLLGFRCAVADDAEMLAALHDCELGDLLLAALREAGFPHNLGLLPTGGAGSQALEIMTEALAGLPRVLDAATRDALGADYAGIYLNNSYRASPFESAWTDADGLLYQQSMFELREIYAEAGLQAVDWRMRAEDHLVTQLLYLAAQARKIESVDQWRRLAVILDEHLLYWVGDFCNRVWARCEQPFYAGLAALTLAWCESLREMIAAAFDAPRPSLDEMAARWRKAAPAEQVAMVYHPGAGPTL